MQRRHCNEDEFDIHAVLATPMRKCYRIPVLYHPPGENFKSLKEKLVKHFLFREVMDGAAV